MNIAMVGGGGHCLFFLTIISTYRFLNIIPKIVAVADLRKDAPGIEMARKKGIHTTDNFKEFLDRDDIDVILDLTENKGVYQYLNAGKKPGVLVLDVSGALELFEERRIPENEKGKKLDLKRTRRLCDLIFTELVNEEVILIDAAYMIVEVNNFPLQKYGLKREDVIGRHCYEISHHRKTPCDEKRYPCPHARIMQTGQPFRCTHIHFDKDGRKIFHSISSYPIFEDNRIVGIVQMARDITWESSIQKSFGDQEKLAAIGRLAAGVAHEINNPLTTILTSAMLIQEEMDSKHPDFSELELITKETLRCREIVANLLKFARQSKPVKQNYDLNLIVADSMALVKKQANFKDISMETYAGPEPIMIYCDRDQIQQCIINLSLNAIDATDPGGKIVFLTKFLQDEGMAQVSVLDTGKGLSEKILDAIFEPFFTTKETGTGLGLSITHGFVRQHRGFIGVESSPGQGAMFTIRLPTAHGEQDA